MDYFNMTSKTNALEDILVKKGERRREREEEKEKKRKKRKGRNYY